MKKMWFVFPAAVLALTAALLSTATAAAACTPDQHTFVANDPVDGYYTCSTCHTQAKYVAPGNGLAAAVTAAVSSETPRDKVLLLDEGDYTVSSMMNITGQATVIGCGEDKTFIKYNGTSKNHIFTVGTSDFAAGSTGLKYCELNLANLKVIGSDKSKQTINAKYNSVTNLYHVTLTDAGWNDIIVDNGNLAAGNQTYTEGLTTTVNAYDVTVSKPVYLNAHPTEYYYNNYSNCRTFTTYVQFNYQGGNIGTVQDVLAQDVVYAGNNLKLKDLATGNETIVNPAKASVAYNDGTGTTTTLYSRLDKALEIVSRDDAPAGDYVITLLEVPTTSITLAPKAGVNVTLVGMPARIGSTYYPTLADAVAAAAAGQTVQLVEDTAITQTIVIDKKLTLDLGTSTITGTGCHVLTVNAGGNLTVNADPTNPGGITGNKNAIYSSHKDSPGAKTIVINGGVFGAPCTFNPYGTSGEKANPLSVTINGGHFKKMISLYRCYYFTANGGTFDAGFSIGAHSTCKTYFNVDGTTGLGGLYKNKPGAQSGKVFVNGVWYKEGDYYRLAKSTDACEAKVDSDWYLYLSDALADVALGKANYKFNGWYTSADYTGQAVTAPTPAPGTVYYAQWLKKPSVTFDKDKQTYTWDGSEKPFQIVDATPADGYTVTYRVNGTYGSYTSTVPTAAGTYDVKITRNEDDTYASLSYTKTGGLVIQRRPLTITAQSKSKVYGEADPQLTYAVTGLLPGDSVTGELTRDAGENAGTYAITQGTLTADANYEIVFQPGTLTVEQKVLTVTAVDKRLRRNTTAPDWSAPVEGDDYVLEGLLPGESVTVTLSCAADMSQRGQFEIVPVVADPSGNYAVTAINGVLDVYAVAVPMTNTTPIITRTEGGTVTTKAINPAMGTKVTFTVKPDTGMQADTVRVTYGGKTITAQAQGNGAYTFFQPLGAATITVTFKPEESSSEPPALGYQDVQADAWYHDAVVWAKTNGIMSGYSSTKFGPDDVLNRAMVVQVLYNYEKTPTVPISALFDDVKVGQWYTNAVHWAADNGIVAGYGNDRFGPEDSVTIEQILVILWNHANNPIPGLAPRSVLPQHSEWAANALKWAVEQGILDNVPFTNATEKATRAQTAQMLMNYLRNN